MMTKGKGKDTTPKSPPELILEVNRRTRKTSKAQQQLSEKLRKVEKDKSK